MRKSKIQKTIQANSGYALYTAIILTGMLILVAYITSNIATKELLFSTAQADSHLAFYNADSGLECALYWDLKNGQISAFDAIAPAGSVLCNSQSNAVTLGTDGLGNPTRTFQFNLSQGCVIVLVTKNLDDTTQIKSYGYNSCSGSHRLERGITIAY